MMQLYVRRLSRFRNAQCASCPLSQCASLLNAWRVSRFRELRVLIARVARSVASLRVLNACRHSRCLHVRFWFLKLFVGCHRRRHVINPAVSHADRVYAQLLLSHDARALSICENITLLFHYVLRWRLCFACVGVCAFESFSLYLHVTMVGQRAVKPLRVLMPIVRFVFVLSVSRVRRSAWLRMASVSQAANTKK